MGLADERAADQGFETLASWLAAHPGLTWAQLGSVLQLPAILIIKDLAASADRRTQLREGIYRALLRDFPDGWSSKREFKRAKLISHVTVRFQLDDELLGRLRSRLDALPEGWLPESSSNCELESLVEDVVNSD